MSTFAFDQNSFLKNWHSDKSGSGTGVLLIEYLLVRLYTVGILGDGGRNTRNMAQHKFSIEFYTPLRKINSTFELTGSEICNLTTFIP